MAKRIVTILILIAAMCCGPGATAADSAQAPAKRTRFLVLDSRIIESAENAKLTLGTVKKDKNNPLFKEDKPWEPRFDNLYPSVIYDEQQKLYKCWYNPMIVEEMTSSVPKDKRNPDAHPVYMNIKPNRREMGLCYAVSNDGIHWKKPKLGIVEFGGNKRNNILMPRSINGAGVIKDLRERNPARRYKIFYSGEKHVEVAFSADGLHWDRPIEIPEIDAHGTHSNAYWAPHLGKYVGVTREHSRGERLVCRTESPDFVKWTKNQVVLKGPNSRQQAHELVVCPTAGIYIGLLGIMEFPEDTRRHVRQHLELAWSPDTKKWHRIQAGEVLIGHTAAKSKKYGTMPYDWGGIFPSPPIVLDNEIRIYYGGSDWYFFDWRKGCLALATLRPDGWAGYEQVDGNKPASITTTPIACVGTQLKVSADVLKTGPIKVTLLDKDNRQIAAGQPITKTVTDAVVRWEKGFSLEKLKGKEIRLRFELRDSKLYSFAFTDPSDVRSGRAGRSKNPPSPADDTQAAMRVLHTLAKTRFGIFGEKPSSPAPTLFVFAVGVDDMDRRHVYSEAGRQLAPRGWLYVTLDPPCHGHDHRAHEPATLSGWAHRVKTGQDLMGPFVKRCVDVLDFLVAQGYTDPQRVAACGTSRGGFCALHFAAAEPRVRAVAGVSPVTNLLALREFRGVTEKQLRSLNVSHLAEKLAGRAVWLSIGDDDRRVGTADCTATARQLTAAARRHQPGVETVPVELVVGPSDGHHPIENAYSRAARFVRKQFPSRAEEGRTPSGTEELVPVGLQKQLFVDDHVVAEKQNVTHVAGQAKK